MALLIKQEIINICLQLVFSISVIENNIVLSMLLRIHKVLIINLFYY